MTQAEQARLLVLVVDQNSRSAEVTATHLRYHVKGLEVMTANSLEQTRELVRRHKVSAFVIDLDGADGNGDELLRVVLAGSPEAKGVLIGRGEPPEMDVQPLLEYLRKPFYVDELLEALRPVISPAMDAEVVPC